MRGIAFVIRAAVVVSVVAGGALFAPRAGLAERRPSQTQVVAVMQGMDKVTARISAFDAPIGKTVRFGTLEIVAHQLIVWLDTAVVGLDPETGKKHWSVACPADGNPMRPVVPIVTPQINGNQLLVSDFYDGATLLEISTNPPSAKVVWRADKNADPQHKQGLNALMTTPVVRNGYMTRAAGSTSWRPTAGRCSTTSVTRSARRSWPRS